MIIFHASLASFVMFRPLRPTCRDFLTSLSAAQLFFNHWRFLDRPSHDDRFISFGRVRALFFYAASTLR